MHLFIRCLIKLPFSTAICTGHEMKGEKDEKNLKQRTMAFRVKT